MVIGLLACVFAFALLARIGGYYLSAAGLFGGMGLIGWLPDA